jgi:hypothetical protein
LLIDSGFIKGVLNLRSPLRCCEYYSTHKIINNQSGYWLGSLNNLFLFTYTINSTLSIQQLEVV